MRMRFDDDGTLLSGHYVFIERKPVSDRELLAQIGLVHDLEPGTEAPYGMPDVYLAHDGKWAHVMDGLHYMLWNSRRFSQRLQSIVGEHDVFRCTFGDCDESYDYSYYRAGRLVRAVDVGSPNYDDLEIRRDFGERLPEERAIGNLVGVHRPNLPGPRPRSHARSSCDGCSALCLRGC